MLLAFQRFEQCKTWKKVKILSREERWELRTQTRAHKTCGK